MIGIYRIKNLVNEKCYYGSSKNIQKRWKTHLNQLRNKKHINCILQRAWDKYGEDNFVFEIVEKCELENIFEVEQKYIDTCGDYNIGLKASGGDNLTKNPNKNEIIGKITDSMRKRYSLMTSEQKKEIFSLPMDKNPNWKGGVTYKYCECGVRIKPINNSCNKCRNKSGENNPFFGKQHSDEIKKKLSESKKGTYYGKQNIPIIIDGVEYRSAGVASKILNIPMVTIRWRVLSKNPKYKNYHYKGEIKVCYSDEEQKIKLSESQKGKKRSFNKPFFIDGVEYRTLKEASEKLNIHQMTIKGRLKSLNFDNYRYNI